MGRPVAWIVRETPLAPVVAVVEGLTARTLAARLATEPERLSRLTGAASSDVLVLEGPSDALPWVDGIRYLGRDPRAPGLRLPTTHTVDVAPELFEEAVTSRASGLPLAVWPVSGNEGNSLRIVSLAGLRRLDPGALAAFARSLS